MFNIKKAATLLALMGGRATVVDGSGSKASLRRKAPQKKSDLMEDIEFWTRMTQAMSVPETEKPSRRPTRRPSRKPTQPPVTLTTDPPTSSGTTYSPTVQVTPQGTTVSPTAQSTTIAPTSQDTTATPTVSSTVAATTYTPTTYSPTVSESFPTVPPTYGPTFVCNLSPEERAEEFIQIALTVTDEDVLNNPASPQFRALGWLINNDTFDPCPNTDPCGTVQRYIMASFYFATEGDNWDQCSAPSDFTDPASIQEANDNCDRVVTPFPVNNPRVGADSTDAWLTPVDECLWGGLACWGTDDQRNGCMDQIDFENDGLSGTLLPEMFNLEQLRFYILEQGDIAGTIPSEYGQFERLLIFDMDFNDLTGGIPEELYDLDIIQQLDLNDNMLSGTLSTRMGQLTSLTFLQLDHNEFSGTIPTEIGLLKALRIAFFNDNDLTGSVPPEICANRNTTSPPGFLGTLVVDCNPPNNPEVECDCCSSCNVIEGGAQTRVDASVVLFNGP